jgi:hypothetical protein
MQSVRRYLTHKRKLTVNEDKSQVAKSDRVSFLGFVLKGTRILCSEKAYREFRGSGGIGVPDVRARRPQPVHSTSPGDGTGD